MKNIPNTMKAVIDISFLYFNSLIFTSALVTIPKTFQLYHALSSDFDKIILLNLSDPYLRHDGYDVDVILPLAV